MVSDKALKMVKDVTATANEQVNSKRWWPRSLKKRVIGFTVSSTIIWFSYVERWKNTESWCKRSKERWNSSRDSFHRGDSSRSVSIKIETLHWLTLLGILTDHLSIFRWSLAFDPSALGDEIRVVCNERKTTTYYRGHKMNLARLALLQVTH